MNDSSDPLTAFRVTEFPGMLSKRSPDVSDGERCVAARFAAPELLAPAGEWDCVRAAVENGADAVYFGLEDGFNARVRATNFSLNNVGEVMLFLHRRDVKGYVTLNTLAFSDELPVLEAVIRTLAESRVDAVLVQDLGVARLIREITSDLPIHASTQMTLTSAECIRVARQLGITRVVLPRELSLSEIRIIRQHTTVELEAFVHGALCVAYSGQCLTSESLGGRSANRGQCAQACRLPYELLCDGELRDFGDQKYLLSPQDLAAFPLTRELIEAGVSSFKIEGRLKSPEYVANITRHYREAIDGVMSGGEVCFSDRQISEMEQSFSRGFSTGWLRGCDHKMLVPALSSSKRGVHLADVVSVRGDRVAVRLFYTVRAGDGIVFEGDRIAGEEQGGRIYQVFKDGGVVRDDVDSGIVELCFASNAINMKRLWPGQKLWKTDDPRLNQELRRTFQTDDPQRRVSLDLNVTAHAGQHLVVEGITVHGCRCQVQSDDPLEVARKHAVTEDLLREQFSRLGGTVYQLRSLTVDIRGAPMVPLSVLGQLRRRIVDQLNDSLPVRRVTVSAAGAVERMRVREFGHTTTASACQTEPRSDRLELAILCRSPEQLRVAVDACRSHPLSISLMADFQDIREYRDAVRHVRQAERFLWLATPRIQKPGESGLFQVMRKYEPDGVLVRNLSGVDFFHRHGVPIAADYTLNVTNELTASFLMQQGLQWLTPSYDLNREQLMQLVGKLPAQWIQIVLHQHMPMFHMEHCVFCAMISPGTDKTNCGRPCDVHTVELRDRMGLDHPLVADVGCRNTLFNAVAQSSAGVAVDLVSYGVGRFRIELLRESGDEIRRIIELYTDLLLGRTSGETVWKSLNAMNRVGVTRGTLEERRNPLAIL